MSKTIKLSSPIGEITEITVRDPAHADFIFVGLVWAIRLASVDPSVLDALAPEDARAVHEATTSVLLALAPAMVADHSDEGVRTWQ